MHLRSWILVLLATHAPACHCESASDLETDDPTTDSETTSIYTSTSGASGVLTGSSGEESTGAPFDASRWIGRYHYENPFVDQWGDPYETQMLVNFEIFEDSTAIMLYDDCAFDWPELIHYEWTPDDEPGWIQLHPGVGQSYLRFLSDQPITTLRVHLIEPCRELQFEYDGTVEGFFPVYPGASCWLNRCTNSLNLQVDYCEGEEPPPCP